MRICVIGAGAIGGLLAARLAQSGQEVSVIARGAHLEAIKRDGLKLIAEDGSTVQTHPKASQSMQGLGPQDVVVLGMKAHQVSAIIADLPSLYHEDTMVLTAQNGIPWWYFQKHGGPHDGLVLKRVDPDGLITKGIDPNRLIGSVVYPAGEIVAPGIIRHTEGNRFSLSEIDNQPSDRVTHLSQVLREAGFKAPVSSDIRAEIWTKLWGNLAFNPISALTHATLAEICAFDPTRSLAAEMMREAQSIGESLGVRFRISIDKRIAGAAAVGEHKTSMLQDVEAGRALELAALMGTVLELGQITGIATPHISAIHACSHLLDTILTQKASRLSLTKL